MDNPRSALAGFNLRAARSSDLEQLLKIENAAFSGDKISRRSFKRFLESSRARISVADGPEGLAGDALILLRKSTALARLYSLAIHPQMRGRGLGARLLAAAEKDAYEADRIVLRLEVREDNHRAIKLYEQTGYRRCGQVNGYYEDGCNAVRMQSLLHGPTIGAGRAPYYSQTTDFTCGPACALMALKHFIPSQKTETLEELNLWREATTIYLASGHGGCGPFGLANALARRGLKPEVRLSPDKLLFLNSVRDPEKRDVLALVQEGYRAEAVKLSVARSDAPYDARGLGELVRTGALAIVLISGYRMFGTREPHWVLVHDVDERHLIVHDPWLEHDRHESAADAANLPIPFMEFDRMARWGRNAQRAQILIRKEH